MRKLLISFSYLVAAGAALATLIGHFGTYHWVLDLFSHFRFQYLVILVLCVFTFTIIKKYRLALFCLPFLIFNSWDIVPFYRSKQTLPKISNPVKIVCINLLSTNAEHALVKDFIDHENPDILVFLEYTPLWKTNLQNSFNTYSERIEKPQADNFGIAVFSKLPFDSKRILDFGLNNTPPSIKTNVILDKDTICLIATHPVPPIGLQAFQSRNAQLLALGEAIQEISQPTVLIGDLNTSSYSYFFHRLITKSGLSDSRIGFGIQPTWPGFFPIMYTTLDHCLISSNISVLSRRTGPDIGSDHFPVIIEVVVSP